MTISSVPIYDFMKANETLDGMGSEYNYSCCGKTICLGCKYSIILPGTEDKCPHCNSDRDSKTFEEGVEEMMKRVEANDPRAMWMLASYYSDGEGGLQQDHAKAMELNARAADLGYSKAHSCMSNECIQRGDMKKAKFHLEAGAIAGNEVTRSNLGSLEYNSGNMGRAIKHWTIAASAGEHGAMHHFITFFKKGVINRESIDSTLTAYNNSCKEMRSEARDAYIRVIIMIHYEVGITQITLIASNYYKKYSKP